MEMHDSLVRRSRDEWALNLYWWYVLIGPHSTVATNPYKLTQHRGRESCAIDLFCLFL